MRMKNFRMAICGSGGFSRGMEVGFQARQVLDKQSRKSCEHKLEFSYAAKHRRHERSARILAGRDPRSPEGDLARKQAGKMGSRRAAKRRPPGRGAVEGRREAT